MPSAGTLLCLASAAAFGAMGIFGKLAYEEGATVGTLLAARFVLAAALFWLFVVCAGGARDLRALSRRDVSIALALGAVAYSAQAATSRPFSVSTPRCSRCSSTRFPRSSP